MQQLLFISDAGRFRLLAQDIVVMLCTFVETDRFMRLNKMGRRQAVDMLQIKTIECLKELEIYSNELKKNFAN